MTQIYSTCPVRPIRMLRKSLHFVLYGSSILNSSSHLIDGIWLLTHNYRNKDRYGTARLFLRRCTGTTTRLIGYKRWTLINSSFNGTPSLHLGILSLIHPTASTGMSTSRSTSTRQYRFFIGTHRIEKQLDSY